MEIHFNGVTIPVKKTRRKGSVGLKVTPTHKVLLIPQRMSERRLHAWVAQHHQWLNEQLHRMQAQEALTGPDESEVEWLFWGDALTVQKVNTVNRPAQAWLQSGILHWTPGKRQSNETSDEALLLDLLPAFYQRQLGRYLFESLPEWAETIGVSPNKVQIKRYKARWGSCDPKGGLQFNWKLAMLPPPVVEYVLIHELCHLRHFNHSEAFWQLVAQHCPNYRTHTRWLREFSRQRNALQKF